MRATGLWLAGFSVWVSCSRWQQGSGMSSRLEPCPETSLSHEQVSQLSREGVETVNANRMGEHHHLASLEAGMPMLKKAALHGDVDAMSKYASLVLWYGFIDNDGDRFLGRTPFQNAKEGLLFRLLAAHRGEREGADDEEAFRVLLGDNHRHLHEPGNLSQLHGFRQHRFAMTNDWHQLFLKVDQNQC